MPQTAPELIVDILRRQPSISAIHIFYPTLSAPIQQMPGLTADELDIISQSLELRSQTDFPFWDCLFQVAAQSVAHMPNLLRTAKRHNAQSATLDRVARSDVLSAALDLKIQKLEAGEVLAISSKVECAGNLLHLPMLDFHCKRTLANDARVKQILSLLDLKGYILSSGQSYHFYGIELVDTDTLITMLARALLFVPMIDRAWIAHQLIERACGLRISSGKSYIMPPTVVDVV